MTLAVAGKTKTTKRRLETAASARHHEPITQIGSDFHRSATRSLQRVGLILAKFQKEFRFSLRARHPESFYMNSTLPSSLRDAVFRVLQSFHLDLARRIRGNDPGFKLSDQIRVNPTPILTHISSEPPFCDFFKKLDKIQLTTTLAARKYKVYTLHGRYIYN
jgi:hypothetical protein